MVNFDAYIKALQEADPSIGIVTDKEACSSYVSKNYSRVPTSAPKAILYPVTPAQVEEIVKQANEYEVPLVVRSSQGDETYHGSSVPAAGKECAAVNLSRMTKIMHIDTRNNMAIIEPGVTFAQLNEALKPYDRCVEHPLLVRAEKSVVASFLDREPVLTPKHGWDTPDPLSCVEMLMGNGTVFRTGSAAGPGTLEEMLESGCAISQPQGPVWLDLVRVMSGSQGTLAIATWASVKIRPIGSVKKQIYVQTDDIDALTAYSTAVIRRRLGENIFILNRRGLAQVTGADPALTAQMPAWTLVADARGFNYFPERYMENQILDMQDLAEPLGLSVIEELDGISNETIDHVIDGISGSGDYWKDRIGMDKVDCFFLSTLDKVSKYIKLAEAAVNRFELDPADMAVYIQPHLMSRDCQIEFLIPAADEKIDDLSRTLSTLLLDNQAFFASPYGEITEAVFEKSSSQTPFLHHIKDFFDEKRIMNPGRLVYGA